MGRLSLQVSGLERAAMAHGMTGAMGVAVLAARRPLRRPAGLSGARAAASISRSTHSLAAPPRANTAHHGRRLGRLRAQELAARGRRDRVVPAHAAHQGVCCRVVGVALTCVRARPPPPPAAGSVGPYLAPAPPPDAPF